MEINKNERRNLERTDFPVLMSARDLQQVGMSRTMAYQTLNRADAPYVVIGGRRFMNRDLFFSWLDAQTNCPPARNAV